MPDSGVLAAGGEPNPLAAGLEILAAAILPHQRQMTVAEVASEAGVDIELARRLRRAMGVPDVPEGEPAFFEQDVDALRRGQKMVDEFGFDSADLLHMARTLGLAAARMAEAVVEFWAERLVDDPGEHGDDGDSELLLASERVEELEQVVGYLVRRHLLDSITRRIASIYTPDSGPTDVGVAVGFADLVGFTSLSEQLNDRETAELIERFEVLATDRIGRSGGRVVKMIGDEVMFSSDVRHAAEIALSLAETFYSPDLPAVRVGVASGPVVLQAGDLYGPVVNLASRATMAARPGTVLVSPPLAEQLRGDDRYELHSIRARRLKGIGSVQLYVLRRAKVSVQGGRRRR